MGRDRLHPAGRPAVGRHRKLVADFRADHHRVRAGLAGRHSGPGPAHPRAAALDAGARHASRRARQRSRPSQCRRSARDPRQPILQPCRPEQELRQPGGRAATSTSMSIPFVLHSFIGPNGAGKTTFFNMLSGAAVAQRRHDPLRRQDITAASACTGARLGIGRSFQILSIFPNLTVFENVRIAVQAQQHGAAGALLSRRLCSTAVNDRTWSMLAAVGLDDQAAEPCINLPHGAKRLLEIAITLAIDARLLLLDEPLAGLAEADRRSSPPSSAAGRHARRPADRARHRPRAGAVRPHHGAAPGPPHRRRQAAEVADNPEVIAAYLGAARTRRAAPPPCARAACRMPQAERTARRQGCRGRLRRQHRAERPRPDRPRGRGGGTARTQRRRQDHDAARADRHLHIDTGTSRFDGATSTA